VGILLSWHKVPFSIWSMAQSWQVLCLVKVFFFLGRREITGLKIPALQLLTESKIRVLSAGYAVDEPSQDPQGGLGEAERDVDQNDEAAGAGADAGDEGPAAGRRRPKRKKEGENASEKKRREKNRIELAMAEEIQ
jgi:hypothetical protein